MSAADGAAEDACALASLVRLSFSIVIQVPGPFLHFFCL